MYKKILVGLAATTIGCGSAFAQVKWDLASAYPVSSFQTKNLLQFAEDVDKETDGELKITVHPGASLFQHPAIKRAVQTGQVQLGEFIMATYQNEWPVFGVDAIPFLAVGYEDAVKLADAEEQLISKKFDTQGAKLLYTVPWPPQGLFLKEPITSLDDLKGGKWRSYNPQTSRLTELLGAQPIVVQGAELSQAVVTGVVDGVWTSADTGYDYKIHKTLKYYYNFSAWLPKNAVIVNKKAFNSLDDKAKNGLLSAATKAAERGMKMSKGQDEKYTALIKDDGSEVIQPDTELAAEMKKRVGDVMLKEWLDATGDEGRTLVNAYRN